MKLCDEVEDEELAAVEKEKRKEQLRAKIRAIGRIAAMYSTIRYVSFDLFFIFDLFRSIN